MPTALITGASRGLGHALAHDLASRGWDLIVDGRDAATLATATARLQAAASDDATVTSIVGDVADDSHRADLAATADQHGRLDLLVNNAGTLGPSPLPPLATVPLVAVREAFEINTVAPLALVQRLLPVLRHTPGTVVNVSSDAAVEGYPGWGVYGPSKAALDHLGAILAAEEPSLRVLTIDPGDMRTDMHQAAFPGEDISDRPTPEEAVPAIWDLVNSSARSGRYRAADLVTRTGGVL